VNYYNENNPHAAAWLRELIRAGHIAPGWVDERSILDVPAAELAEYRQCHFFAGIGGWSLALRLAGWPDDDPVWTGSCPCQPFSAAGKRQVDADERHLWPAFRARIAERRPAIIFGEQVASKDGRIWLAGVRADLEAMGYALGAADLCAAGLGAPHIRQRLFWVAQSQSERWQGMESGRETGISLGPRLGSAGANGRLAEPERPERRPLLPQHERHGRDAGRDQTCGEDGGLVHADDAECEKQGGPVAMEPEQSAVGRAGRFSSWSRFDLVLCADGKARRFEPGSFPLADGLPGRVGLLRGYGNAIVPPLAAEFISAAREAIQTLNPDENKK
jgi:DNA (cytosine-5)-methyltransferase 1